MKKVFTLISMLLAFAASTWADPGDIVTDLGQLSSSKTYVIENMRGRLGARASGIFNLEFSGYDGISNPDADNDNDEQRFFIFQSGSGDGIYIYSIAAQKFLVPHRSENGLFLEDSPVLISINDEFQNPGAFNINPAYSGQATDGDADEEYRWFLAAYLDNTDQYKWLNLGGGTWKFDTWSRPDPGNRLRFVETATKDTDPANPEDNVGTTRLIKAYLSYNGTPWKEAIDEVVIGNKLTVPGSIKNPLITIGEPKLEGGEAWRWVDEEGNLLVPTMRQANADTLDIYYDSTWGAPFDLSTGYEDAKWYNMDIRRSSNAENPKYIVYDPEVTSYKCAAVSNEKDLMLPEYHWALIGDPINGMSIINRAAGEGMYLQTDDKDNIVMLEGEFVWEVTGVAEGTYPAAISICLPGTNKFANELSNGGKLGIWDSSAGRNDGGSLLRFTEAPESATPLTKITLNATFNGEIVKTATVQAFVDTPLEEVIPGTAIDNGLVDLEYSGNVTENMVLNVPATLKEDFELALDKSKWYNLSLRDQYWVNAVPQGDKGNYHKVVELLDADLDAAQYQWAFEGNPYQVKVYNRAYGEKNLAYYIDPDNNTDYAAMRDTVYYWDIYANNEGFTLGASNVKGQYINDNGRNLRYWNVINDGGSKFLAFEVANLADPVQDMAITYHLNYNGEEVKKITSVAFSGDFVEAPVSFTDPLLEVDSNAKDAEGNLVEQIPDGASTLDVYYNAVWAGIFDLSTSFADAHWYNIDMRRAGADQGYRYLSYGGTAPYSCAPIATAVEDEYGFISYEEDTEKLAMTNYQWAIIGDPFKGVQIVNRAAGEGKTLGVNASNVPEFIDGVYTWDIIGVDKNDGLEIGFALKTPDANNWLNHFSSNTLGLWVNGSGTDDGSIFRVSEVPESTKKQAEITFNAIYNGETIKTAKFYAFEGEILNEAVKLPEDWNNGLVELEYDEEAVVTDGMTVNANVTMTYDLDLTGATWYNLEVRDNYWVNTARINGDGHYMPEDKANVDDETLNSNEYLWAFLGNPYQFSIFNAALKGTLANLPVGDHCWAVVQEGVNYLWNGYGFTNDEDGTYAFGVEYSDKPGNYINQEGGSGNTRPLGYWNGGSAKYDGGAKLRAFATDAKPDYEVSGIENAQAKTAAKAEAIYNLNGARQQTLNKGLNIVRLADGRTVKVIVK